MCFLFADDMMCFLGVKSISDCYRLQAAIECVLKGFSVNCLSLKPQKTVFSVISKKSAVTLLGRNLTTVSLVFNTFLPIAAI